MSITEKTLLIFAHPDDVAWTCAGTVARETQAGEKIDQIMVTSGGFGGDESKKDQRLEEERSSMNVLGMETLYPLDFPDGEMSQDMFGDLVGAVVHVIDSARERGIIYRRLMSFGPEDGYSGHPDHKVVARAVEYAFRMRDQIKELAQVMMSPDERELWPDSWNLGERKILVPRPDVARCRDVNISGTIFQKIEAIRTHTSQLAGENGGLAQIQRIQRTAPIEHWRVFTRP